MRRKRIEQAYLDGLSQMEYMLDAVASPEDQMQIIQAINQLCKALEGVSDKAQQAFILHYLEGYTHKEIAERLNVSTKMIQKIFGELFNSVLPKPTRHGRLHLNGHG